jgi:uncharacterized protein YfaS (alpha-2-macroglobulin family)
MSPAAQAYAWYVLAKAGLADPGRVRYFQDTRASDIHGGLAWVQLAAALNKVGEPGRARLAFNVAQTQLNERQTDDYYGSLLRDRAAMLALASEAGGRDAVAQLLNSVRDRLVAKGEYTTTQEQAWLVLAAKALSAGGEVAYSVDGQSRKSDKEPVVINPTAPDIERGLHVKNEGEKAVWMQVTARGVPKEPQPAASQGISIRRSYYTLAGEPVDLANLRQNDRVLVSISGRNDDGGYHEAALLDLLPAGLEIESVVNKDTAKSFPFLSELTPTRIIEARDDRFFAAFDLGRRPYRNWWYYEEKSDYAFNVAYVARAVTPGTFALPAAHVSDMYAPRIFGRTAMDRLTVTAK